MQYFLGRYNNVENVLHNVGKHKGYIFLNRLRKFLKLESASGIILFLMALVALALNNSSLAPIYQAVLKTSVELHIAEIHLKGGVLFLINEGLMTLFFLQVGLELKREFAIGELAQLSRVLLPAVAALGGMIIPAFIYLGINLNHVSMINGWAIPVATDIAFSLGVLSLLGNRVPIGLKLFLMTLAIFDDMGAIVIIALFQTHTLSLWPLIGAVGLVFAIYLLNKLNVQRIGFYLFFGLLLWFCVLESGVHATVAGVLLAFLIPVKVPVGLSPLEQLENKLHPWVAYFIMPLFALANAGVSLVAFPWSALLNGITLGIVLGLFLGKQAGVLFFSWLMIKLRWAKLPAGSSWMELWGVSILCGIGFTMSLFLGTLAFYADSPAYLCEMRIGVLLGSLLSGIVGAWVLSCALQLKNR